jgi:3-oxoadipate enol-lactonase
VFTARIGSTVHRTDRIDRLVLVNTAAWLGGPPVWDEQIAGIQATSDSTALAGAFLQNWFSEPTLTSHEELIARFREDLLAQSLAGLASSLAIVRDADFRRTDLLISVPTLVIVGEHDAGIAPDNGRQIAKTIPGAEMQTLPGTHLASVELSAEFNQALLRFLAR